ncbi:RNA-directed DNA polymerase, eukaryota [Tanacetum coccineum]
MRREGSPRDKVTFCNSSIGIRPVMEIYGPEFLRKPTVTDVEKLFRHHEEKHGFPGMLGSLDSPKIPFVANGVTYPSGYYLVDGIYPELTLLVKTIPEPADDDHKRILYKQKQKSTRKDVERAFGVLKKKWAILVNPTRVLRKDRIDELARAQELAHEARLIRQAEIAMGMHAEEHVLQHEAKLTGDHKNTTGYGGSGLNNRHVADHTHRSYGGATARYSGGTYTTSPNHDSRKMAIHHNADVDYFVKINKSNSGTRKNDQLRLKKQLEEIDLDIDRGLGNEELVNSRLAILHQIQKIDNLESKEMAQKAKIKWAVEGDENSGFFHGIINKRRNIQNIRGVMVDGNWIENPNDVKKEFFDHFANRFGKPDKPTASISLDFPNQISHEQSDHMEREVSNDEIKKSVWECGTDKAPGPDGFTFGFFRHFWHLVDRDVCEAVRYFFKFSDLPKGCNSSFIALIPKIPDANLVKDFRPISLIGSIYKIIAKILTNRLVDVLGGIINEVQSAFIKDRQILDGPFILNEVMSWCKKKKKQTLLFKVDFEKAYDSVRWDFLDDVLGKFGFGDKWRKWIQCCLHSSKGSIIINGSPTDEFQFGRGLKQGDPLSPFLFLLIMESLHISFQRVVDAGMFHGIDVGGLVNLSHMFYADDAVFIGEWSESNITSLIHVLDCFHKVSGLKINMCKSKIMGIEVDNGKVSRAATKFGCLVLKAPFLYLGSYVGGDMNKIQSWKDIIDRIRRRLSRWKMKMLSIGGRLMLIKSVLGSMPIFHMSMFKVPAGVIQILESLRSKFFNGHESSGKKASWVQWKKALAPKDNGGLGIFSLYALNRGLIFKWVWRFLAHEPTLWSRVIKAIHGANGKIDEISGKGANSCWINIIKEVRRLEEKGINLLLFMKKKLGNGLSTLFWDDVWCDGGKLKNRFPRAYALENSKQITVGQKLAHPSLYHSFRRHPRGGLELTQVEELAKVINPVVLTQSPDSWSWTLNNSGGYTVASSRNMIDSRLLPKGDLKTRWIRYVPNKVNTFAWKVMTNSLPTRFNISRRGIDIESLSCVNCDVGIETNDHLFFACNTAKKISKLINRWWDVPFMDINSYGEWRSWIDNVKLPKKNKSMFQGIYFVMWWLLWNFRNKKMFEAKPKSKETFFDEIICSSYYWCRYRCNTLFSWDDWYKNPSLISL